jgi:hypothetical protein
MLGIYGAVSVFKSPFNSICSFADLRPMQGY